VDFPASKGLTAQDGDQVRRWASWSAKGHHVPHRRQRLPQLPCWSGRAVALPRGSAQHRPAFPGTRANGQDDYVGCFLAERTASLRMRSSPRSRPSTDVISSDDIRFWGHAAGNVGRESPVPRIPGGIITPATSGPRRDGWQHLSHYTYRHVGLSGPRWPARLQRPPPGGIFAACISAVNLYSLPMRRVCAAGSYTAAISCGE